MDGAERRAEWDSQTLETWIRENSTSPRFRRIVPVATRPIFGAEPRELSLLFVLFYIAASGDEQHPGTFERNFNTRDGAQMFRFGGGSQRIAIELARRLGSRVLLRQPVRRIDQSAKRRHGRLRPAHGHGAARDRHRAARDGRADRVRPAGAGSSATSSPRACARAT